MVAWTKEYDGAAEPDSGGGYDWTLVGTAFSSSSASPSPAPHQRSTVILIRGVV